MLVGRVPFIDVVYMCIDCRLLNSPIDVGRAPLRESVSKYKYDNFDRDPMVSGMVPKTHRSKTAYETK
jgi:hypothetical protein